MTRAKKKESQIAQKWSQVCLSGPEIAPLRRRQCPHDVESFNAVLAVCEVQLLSDRWSAKLL